MRSKGFGPRSGKSTRVEPLLLADDPEFARGAIFVGSAVWWDRGDWAAEGEVKGGGYVRRFPGDEFQGGGGSDDPFVDMR